MTNAELEELYTSHAGLSHAAALRVVYAAGYHAGGGSSPALVPEPSYTAAKPSEANLKEMKRRVTKA